MFSVTLQCELGLSTNCLKRACLQGILLLQQGHETVADLQRMFVVH